MKNVVVCVKKTSVVVWIVIVWFRVEVSVVVDIEVVVRVDVSVVVSVVVVVVGLSLRFWIGRF